MVRSACSRTAAVGNVRSLIDIAAVTFYVLAFLGARFVYRLYTYGHELDPHAPFDIEFAAGIAFTTVRHLVTGRRAAERAERRAMAARRKAQRSAGNRDAAPELLESAGFDSTG